MLFSVPVLDKTDTNQIGTAHSLYYAQTPVARSYPDVLRRFGLFFFRMLVITCWDMLSVYFVVLSSVDFMFYILCTFNENIL
jgi:hypothetical protein